MSKRQTVFFTSVNPKDKEHKDPYDIDLNAPRLPWYKQKKVEKASRHGVLGQYTTCSTKRIEILSNKIVRNHPVRHTSSLLYPGSCCDGIWYVINKKVYASPRPSKISLKRNWMKESYSGVAGSSKDTQRIQPKPKTQLSRTVRPVDGPPSSQSCVSMPAQIVDKCEDEDQISTGRLVNSGQSIGLFTQREEIDIDFRVSGLPHAFVKQAENFRVRELVKMIEIHPHRDALQAGKITSTTHSETIRKR